MSISEGDVADTVREPVLVRRVGGSPRPKYRESAYRRSLIQRFTPFMWFIMTMCVIGLVVAVVLIVNGISSSQHRSVTLDERLAELQKISPTSFALTAAAQAPTSALPTRSVQANKVAALLATATPRPSPTLVPTLTPTPTPNPNDAPWANQMIQQPDRTLLAPQVVIDQAVADVSAYFASQSELTVKQYMQQRYDLLTAYFTGSALDALRESESKRKEYAQKRAGNLLVDVRNFSPDGREAIAGVTKRGWVNDVFDVTTGKLIKSNSAEPDSLTVYAIVFDRNSGHWKFAAIEATKEVQP